MKKVLSLVIVVLIAASIMTLFSSCGDSSLKSKLVGTWEGRSRNGGSKDTYTFYSDGRVEKDNKSGTYTIGENNKLTITLKGKTEEFTYSIEAKENNWARDCWYLEENTFYLESYLGLRQ